MNHKNSVGKKSLAFSRNLGLTISFAIHVVLGSGFVALNTGLTEEEEFELLESKSIELNSLSGEELAALLALLESDPEVSDSTNLPLNSEAESSSLLPVSSEVKTTESKKKNLNPYPRIVNLDLEIKQLSYDKKYNIIEF